VELPENYKLKECLTIDILVLHLLLSYIVIGLCFTHSVLRLALTSSHKTKFSVKRGNV